MARGPDSSEGPGSSLSRTVGGWGMVTPRADPLKPGPLTSPQQNFLGGCLNFFFGAAVMVGTSRDRPSPDAALRRFALMFTDLPCVLKRWPSVLKMETLAAGDCHRKVKEGA